MGQGLVSELEASGLPRHAALKAVIATSGIRQFAVANRVGVSDSHLSKILSGRKPLPDELAMAIEIAINELRAELSAPPVVIA
jgi:DNA-binding transcriptional regulator YdaS (Cro superfamily)